MIMFIQRKMEVPDFILIFKLPCPERPIKQLFTIAELTKYGCRENFVARYPLQRRLLLKFFFIKQFFWVLFF